MRKLKNQAGKFAYRILLVVCAVMPVLMSWFFVCETSFAKGDTGSGYGVIIEDDADLLTEEEEDELRELMEKIAVYGNVAFKSIDYNSVSTASYIDDYYDDLFGYESGTVFLIDMDNRNIQICSAGAVYKTITNSYADTITDNVYRYASDADYFTCAYKAFEQILALLQGSKIAQPMKYISNAFFAIILALMINYFIVKMMSVSVRPNEKELLAATRHGFSFDNQDIVHTGTTKRYDPPSSSGGSHGHSGGGSRGGGSRGGGGHRF